MTPESLRMRLLPAPPRDARPTVTPTTDFIERAQDLLRSAGFVARICALNPAPAGGRRAVGVTVKAGDPRIRWISGASQVLVPCALHYRPGLQLGDFVLYSGLAEAEVESFTAALLDRAVQDSFAAIDLGPWDPHQTDRDLAAEIDAHFELLRAMHDTPFPFL